MDPIPLSPPYLGVNQKVPIQALPSPYCENLLNFNSTLEGVTLRHGDSKTLKITDTIGNKDPIGIFAYGTSNLFMFVLNSVTSMIDVYDVETAAVVDSFASGGNFIINGYSLFFGGYFFFFADYVSSFSRAYSGAAWGAVGWTGASLNIHNGTVFKERAYLVQRNATYYWYTEIKAISGALNKVDLSTVISEFGYIAIITPIALADNVAVDNILAFVFFSGEILFYSGSYPNSSDWGLVGRAKIGSPLNYGSGIKYQGDYLVFHDGGVTSLRDLFLKGSEQAINLSVHANIASTWKSLIKEFRGSGGYGVNLAYIEAAYDNINGRIIITFPRYLDSTGTIQVGNFQFIFNTELTAWYFHQNFSVESLNVGFLIQNIAFYKGKTYLLSNAQAIDGTNDAFMILQKEGATGFADRNIADTADVGFDYEIKSAPVASNRAYVQKGCAIDFIMKSDLYSQTNFYFVRDLGVETTTAQKMGTVPSTLQKPMANIGIEGSYIQYKVSGTTVTAKTVGLQMNSSNFWIEPGETPR